MVGTRIGPRPLGHAEVNKLSRDQKAYDNLTSFGEIVGVILCYSRDLTSYVRIMYYTHLTLVVVSL